MDSRLLWGMLDMLILDVISRGPTYGYQIAQTVMSQSKGYFDLKEGSLYPALHRLERQKWLTSYWEDVEEGRRRKFYKITPAGRKTLEDKRDEWSRFTSSVESVLGGSRALA
jgi:PadR family transcriptional regulator PadR